MGMGRPGGEAAATVAGEGAGYLRRVCKAGFRRRVSTRRPRAAWFFVGALTPAVPQTKPSPACGKSGGTEGCTF